MPSKLQVFMPAICHTPAGFNFYILTYWSGYNTSITRSCWSYCDAGSIVLVHASIQLCHGGLYPHYLNLCRFSGAVDDTYPAPIIQRSSYCALDSIYLQKSQALQNQQTGKHGFLRNMMEITSAYLHSPTK